MPRVKYETDQRTSKAEKLQLLYTGTKISWTWLGSSRKVPGDLQREINNVVESTDVRSSTPLHNWKLTPLAALVTHKNAVRAWWMDGTVPYIEDGVRLLRKENVEWFEEYMGQSLQTLSAIAREVQRERDSILTEAKARRGKAFSYHDYPPDLSQGVGLSWAFTSLEVPSYLKNLSESVYAAEQARQGLRLAMAVELGEESFARELKAMVDNLCEKLEPPPGGGKKVVRDSTVNNLLEFFSRFSEVVAWGADDLEEIVNEAREVLTGVDPEDLRRSSEIKKQVGEGLGEVSRKLALMVGENQA